MQLQSMYQDIILDHYRNPHGRGLRDPFEAEVHHVNPTCGDEVTLRVHLEGDTIADVSYEGMGCSISQASVSAMYDLVIGKSVTEALGTGEQFMRLMQSKGDTAVADWRFQVPSETSNIRVSMYVNPMSRAVVYFVQLANLAEGNTDALPFVESIVPGEETAGPAPVAQSETVPAADAAATATSEAAPSTDSAANSGVKEYNADGQETTEGSQSAPLDGATTGAVVAGIVVVVVIAGVVAYFAYLKPTRAKQAAAAAAAAAAAKPKGK